MCPVWSVTHVPGRTGKNGIPGIALDRNPVLCSDLTLTADNSLGGPTGSVLFIGLIEASLPTEWDGTLLLLPRFAFTLLMPTGGLALKTRVPCDNGLCGVSLFMQVLEFDPLASKGVSFTPGLHLVFGGS
jgi:hypothetical protein